MFKSKLMFLISIACLSSTYQTTHCKDPKIVGLLQIRNEENIIESCLHALVCYTDAIVIVDDASTDNTVSIVKDLAKELNIEKIVERTVSTRESGHESDNSQMLLDIGREIGGTHFIVIDADEVFTSNCKKNNYLRNQILSLQPGDSLCLWWIQLWRSVKSYRVDLGSPWTNSYGSCIFCDDSICYYPTIFLHSSRIPNGLSGTNKKIEYSYGVLHFQFVNWRNLLVKQAWYRCLERIRQPNKPASQINDLYGLSKDEKNLQVKNSLSDWFVEYASFDPMVYDKPSLWREEQVISWFEKYGRSYFADLDIWDIDWNQH